MLVDKELVDAASVSRALRSSGPCRRPTVNALRNLVAVLAAAIAEVGVRGLQGEDAGEGVAGGQGAQLGGRRPEA